MINMFNFSEFLDENTVYQHARELLQVGYNVARKDDEEDTGTTD